MDDVLHLTNLYPPFVGGTEEYARKIAEGLSNRGYRSTVLTSDGLFQGLGHPIHDLGRETERYEPRSEVVNGVTVERVPYCHSTNIVGERVEQVLTYGTQRLLSPIAPVWSGLFRDPVGVKLFRRGRSFDPDLIHATSVDDSSIAAAVLLAEYHDVPCVVRPFWHFEEYDPGAWRPIFERATSVVTSTEFEREFLESSGVPAEKLTVVGCGIDYESITAATGEKSPIDSEQFSVLIMSSRSSEGKGVPQSIEAARDLSGVTFYLAGPQNGLDESTLPDNCEYVGILSEAEKNAAFHTADAFLLPSVEESFGIVYMEALSARTPVITGDIPVSKELYSDVGIQADPESPGEIAHAIRTMRDEKDVYESYAQNARDVAEQYDWSRVIEETERHFEKTYEEYHD